MVDIVKFSPYVPTSFPSNIHNLRYKPPYQQVTVPIFFSTIHKIPQNNHKNDAEIKRWIGQSSYNKSHFLDASTAPYGLHRKVMYQELYRNSTTTVHLKESLKTKQQRNISKETTKTKLTTGIGGTNVTSQPSFCNSDVQSSRLFDTLSKHVTIKAEPLRPSNNFANSSTNTSTSWQRYWELRHTQRRRNETNDCESLLSRRKREQPIRSEIQFITQRDSSYLKAECHTDNKRPSSPPCGCSSPKLHISEIPEKKMSLINEDDISKEMSEISTIEIVTSSLTDMNASMALSKTLPLESIDKNDEKYISEEQSLLSSSLSSLSSSSSSSQFKSDSQIIEEVANAQKPLIPIKTKSYTILLPLDKSNNKKVEPKKGRRTRSKSLEKKRIRTPSATKRRRTPSATKRQHQISTNKIQQSSLSTLMTTTSRTKYSKTKWDEPYTGLRFDPPTPPCSPELFDWPQDSDQDDNDTPFEHSEIFQHNSTVKVLENCNF